MDNIEELTHIVAIVCLTAIIIAGVLLKGIDGLLLASGVAAIAGIAGYKINEIKKVIEEKKA